VEKGCPQKTACSSILHIEWFDHEGRSIVTSNTLRKPGITQTIMNKANTSSTTITIGENADDDPQT